MKFRKVSLAYIAVGALALGMLSAAPANAAESDEAIVGALDSLQLLEPTELASTDIVEPMTQAATGDARGALDAQSGLTVGGASGWSSVEMKPMTEAAASITPDGKVLTYSDDDSFGYALTGSGTKANAGYVVVNDTSAPEAYRFEISVGGKPAQLSLENGGVTISDSSGSPANFVLPAWAKDASGKSLTTSYSVDGNVITQHVDHRGASYPVVADPGLACDFLFCTYMYDRGQTSTIANYGGVGVGLTAAGCAAIATVIAGALCAAYGSWIVGAAADANGQGRCVGVRHFHYSSPGLIFPVIENC